MDIDQIIRYWADNEVKLYSYKSSRLNNPRIFEATINFLINCGLPYSCAPGLSFEEFNDTVIPTPNQVFNISIDELNDYLIIGNNGNGDPVCIDINNENVIVFLNHDNDFERVYMNSSVHQLMECIIRYKEFHASLAPRFENYTLIKRKFSNEEFSKVCDEFKVIDDRCLLDNNCWKTELDCLLWERDNE